MADAAPNAVPVVRKKLAGYVGFANLPNQVHRKSVRKGFQFTAMVVGKYQRAVKEHLCSSFAGESGLGKSTLINTLFNTTLYPPKEPIPPSVERPKTVAIQSISAGTCPCTSLRAISRSQISRRTVFVSVSRSSIPLALATLSTTMTGATFLWSITHFAHFQSWKPIVEDIESRFDAYLEQESRINRQKTVDNRVHACLYFIQPTGHS